MNDSRRVCNFKKITEYFRTLKNILKHMKTLEHLNILPGREKFRLWGNLNKCFAYIFERVPLDDPNGLPRNLQNIRRQCKLDTNESHACSVRIHNRHNLIWKICPKCQWTLFALVHNKLVKQRHGKMSETGLFCYVIKIYARTYHISEQHAKYI